MDEKHLRSFAMEWADLVERHVRKRMKQLGVPVELVGVPDSVGQRSTFNPNEFQGGGVNSLGIEVDAGIFNDGLLWDQRAGKPLRSWRMARLRHRIDAVIADEWTEYRLMSLQHAHDLAVELAPQTPGISPEAVAILEEMRELL